MKVKLVIGSVFFLIPLLIFLVPRGTEEGTGQIVQDPDAEGQHGKSHHKDRMAKMVRIIMPLYSEAGKRSPEHRTETPESIQQEIEDCADHFEKAVEARRIHVDTTHLGGCNGETVIWHAHTPEDLRALIDAGAEVNVQDENGETPLHFMAMVNQPDLVKVLLDAGADPRASFASALQSPLEISYFQAEVDREVHSQLLAKVDQYMKEYDLPKDEFWEKFPRLEYSINLSFQDYNDRSTLEAYIRSAMAY